MPIERSETTGCACRAMNSARHMVKRTDIVVSKRWRFTICPKQPESSSEQAIRH